MDIVLQPIGVIRSPFTKLEDRMISSKMQMKE